MSITIALSFGHLSTFSRRDNKGDAINAITPMQSAAITMQQRGEKYAQRMAGISEKVVPHLESLEPADILEKAREIELHDRWSRRNYGLDHQPPNSGPVSASFLINQAVIQVASSQK